MVSLSLRSNVTEIRGQLQDLQKRLPAAEVRALNRLGRQVVLAEQEEMDRVFDRPTPWTKRGVRQAVASQSRPIFRVWLEESGGKGNAPAQFLAAQIQGGPRRHKRFERALIAKGLMPSGSFAVPGPQAPLDGYGNVPGSFIVRMLSDLQAFGEQGYRANRRGRRTGARRSNYFFVPRPGSALRPGVYWKMPGGLIGLVFHFVSRVSYERRFDFYGVGVRAFNRDAARIMTEELRRVGA